jgi:predicted Abi (CAAX) family protease
MAFVTAIIFLLTRNLWLLVPIHWGIEVICPRLLAGFSEQLGIDLQRTADGQD